MPTSWLPIPPDDFAVRVWRDGAAMWVAISGELDLATGPRLIAAVAEHDLAHAGDVGEVIIDLAALNFIDGAGLRALLQIRSTQRVRVVNSRPAARRLFTITGMGEVLGIG